ncbi:hypothetical protein F442_02377 [Phytophthora nicotianae P10297]|uniref:Uncharacterized protein n=1 Tax=Phytophthora nicotianae P10297 TaxID=1317064 RepID=W3A276_PHYNI|nr:hypothetical protein F442_02377 [Phytophthora nicotianae P10297]
MRAIRSNTKAVAVPNESLTTDVFQSEEVDDGSIVDEDREDDDAQRTPAMSTTVETEIREETETDTSNLATTSASKSVSVMPTTHINKCPHPRWLRAPVTSGDDCVCCQCYGYHIVQLR